MKPALIISLLFCMLCACNNDHNDSGSTDEDFSKAGTVDELKENPDSIANAARLVHLMNTSGMQMQSVTSSGDADNDFARIMIIHHQGAIDLSEMQLRKTKDSALINLGREIIASSREEILRLDSFIHNATDRLENSEARGNNPSEKGTNDFARKFLALSDTTSVKSISMGAEMDTTFARLMIIHHMDGVKMAKAYLPFAKAGQPKSLAQSIIKQQPHDINKLSMWLDSARVRINARN